MAKFNNAYNVCGKNPCKIRTIQNLSQADFARKAQLEGLNVDKKTFSLIENGKRGFQDYEILCFARALGVPASYILEGIPEA